MSKTSKTLDVVEKKDSADFVVLDEREASGDGYAWVRRLVFR